jgi:hypothetical protein
MHWDYINGEHKRFEIDVRKINVDAGPYDDRVGPTVLVITLFCAVIINFYLKFTSQ